MNIFRVNTTAYGDEDFYIQSSLTAKQITDVIEPIVTRERSGGEEYENDDLLNALSEAYPRKKITSFYDFEKISI